MNRLKELRSQKGVSQKDRSGLHGKTGPFPVKPTGEKYRLAAKRQKGSAYGRRLHKTIQGRL